MRGGHLLDVWYLDDGDVWCLVSTRAAALNEAVAAAPGRSDSDSVASTGFPDVHPTNGAGAGPPYHPSMRPFGLLGSSPATGGWVKYRYKDTSWEEGCGL